MNDKLEELNSEELGKKAVEWVNSPEGEQVIKEKMEQADKTTKKLQEARKIDQKSWKEPITI